jgi:3-hydroxyacyl-[acyl-carrier-protein] dehydratase
MNVLAAPLSADELMRFLPHRPPFFFLKQLVEWDPGKRAVSHVEFAGDEFFFRGHFPGRPIVPGVILVEAAAQTGGLALASSFDDAPIGGKLPALAKIREMRFRAPARPNELLVIEADVTTRFGPLGVVEVRVRRGDTPIAAGDLALGLASAPD